jgi:ATP-dependent helicase/nuclease subunit B
MHSLSSGIMQQGWWIAGSFGGLSGISYDRATDSVGARDCVCLAHQQQTADTPVQSPILTIPAGAPFLDALAASILNRSLPIAAQGTPVDLPRWTVLLPTKRAGRALQDAFIRAADFGPDGGALLLPAIRPIAEGDEAASLLLGIGELGSGLTAGVAPAMPELHRRIVLTQLILAWSSAMASAIVSADPRATRSPAEASLLAASLATLIDRLETEGVSFDLLPGLVPEGLASHWQQTLDFLQIVTQAWPAYLATTGLISAASRRNQLLNLEAARLSHPAQWPVIIAGITGSIPATAAVMRAVAAKPGNAIILPGLDLDLDAASWQALLDDPAHPQFRLAHLLATLGVDRAEVQTIPGLDLALARGARSRFISEAMRPAATTQAWSTFAERMPAPELQAALESVVLIEAGSAEEEAEAVALILREAAEHPDQTAALVSPDRTLARRVQTRLSGWGITIDDSAGRPFAKTVPGAFLDLLLDAFASQFAAAPTMSLLKHPLTRLGLGVAPARRAARMLELAAFRRTYLGQGLAGIAAALNRSFPEARLDEDDEDLERPHRAARAMAARDRTAARDLLQRLQTAMAPLLDLALGTCDLATLAAAHRAVAVALATDENGSDDALWSGEAGAHAEQLFVGLTDPTLPPLALDVADYRDFYRSLIRGESVRSLATVHPRLNIWGPFEARLQQPDIVILGGLVDGVWPEIAEPDPWLNRPMLRALGLPSPEARLGDAAHDFTQLLGASKVYLTRATKVDGVPKVASRWLLRMKALLDGAQTQGNTLLAADRPWLEWARTRTLAGPVQPHHAPSPRPPVRIRPRQISVTRIETWLKNPYAIYASKVLKLEPMAALGHEPDDRLRGMMVHAVLNRFSRQSPTQLPDACADVLFALIDQVLAEYRAHPRIAALWRPRLQRFATWFAATEPERRVGVERVITEIAGAITLTAPGGDFVLTTRADRIDVLSDGGVILTDYKSGNAPKPAKVESLLSPQLPLEAAIHLAGGFEGLGASPVALMRYISAKGGEPPGQDLPLAFDAAGLASLALDGVRRLVADFDDPAMPYRALRRPGFSYLFDDYAHLARVKAWQNADTAEGEDHG